MSNPPDEDATRAVVESLAPDEQAVLPSRLRALVADDATAAWNEAKAERDAALEAAYGIEDPDERAAAVRDARDGWANRKRELLRGKRA